MARTKGSKNKVAGTSDGYNAYVKELEDKVARYESKESTNKLTAVFAHTIIESEGNDFCRRSFTKI